MDEQLKFWSENLIDATFEEPQQPTLSGWKTELVRLFGERSNLVVISVAVMCLLCIVAVNVVWADDFTWLKFIWCLLASSLIVAVWFVATNNAENYEKLQKGRPEEGSES